MNDRDTFAKRMESKSNAMKEEGFKRWMDMPETRVLVSLIPPNEHADLVRTILQAAYNSGFATGQIGTIMEVLMLSGRERP